MPARIGLPPSTWPDVDRARWTRAITRENYFDVDGAANRWRPKTRYQAQSAYGRWLGHLQRVDSTSLLTAPEQRADVSRLRQYLEARQTQLSAMSMAAEIGHLRLALRAIAPTGNWMFLREWQRRWERQARPRERRDQMVDPTQLVALGRELMTSAPKAMHPVEQARCFRDGLLIALLAYRPMRRRTLSALQLGEHVQQIGERYVLLLADAIMKSNDAAEFDVPEALTADFQGYLEHYRPRFPGAARQRALWLSSKGGSLAGDAIYRLVCRHTRSRFGVAVYPHLFRRIAATTIARAAPQSLSLARDLLVHAKLETTQNYYTQAQTACAARQYATILEKRKIFAS